MSNQKIQKIKEALNRGVSAIYPSREALEKVMFSGKKLKIYLGIDPTGPDLHLGHAVGLLKLRQFQELGHEIIILIGDFTARIGDPTERLSMRRPLLREEIIKNTKNYKKQISKILDIKKSNVRFLHNEEWTKRLKPENMLELASCFTVSRLLERDMFQERIKAGKEIYVNEFIYPIFQAYDSVTMKVDMEIGGSDQIFNMLAGRTLMKKVLGREKFVLATKLLEDPTGKKMGKTEGNMVKLSAKPEEMYGKIMSWPDELIAPAYELITQESLPEVIQVKKDLEAGKNPKILKMLLAYSVVKIFYDSNKAIAAEEYFKRVFNRKKPPKEVPELKVKSKKLIDILIETKLANSKSEARRLINQGGIKIESKVIKDENFKLKSFSQGILIQKGKRYFVKVFK